MNTKIKSLTHFYLILGVVCGFLLGTSLNNEYSAITSKIISILSLVILVIFGRKIEMAFHNEDIQNWSTLRTKGKLYFIITRYVLFRGIVVFTLFILPALSNVPYSNIILFALASGFLLFVSFLSYYGFEEWKNSEQEYTILLLKSVGEQTRIAQN